MDKQSYIESIMTATFGHDVNQIDKKQMENLLASVWDAGLNAGVEETVKQDRQVVAVVRNGIVDEFYTDSPHIKCHVVDWDDDSDDPVYHAKHEPVIKLQPMQRTIKELMEE